MARSFKLLVRDKLGQAQKAEYTSAKPGGIVSGFVSRRFPNGTCGAMTFEGKPSELDIEVGDILYLSYDTGTGYKPVHMGVVVSAPDSRSGERGTYEVASGKELFKRSATTEAAYYTQDVAPTDISYFLRLMIASAELHPALKYTTEYTIPLLGVMVQASNARKESLYEAIQGVLKGVPQIGENDWGVNATGHIIINPVTSAVKVPYAAVKTQFKGSIDGSEVVTKAVIRVANTLSEGAIASPGYVPSVITYAYTAPEHAQWRALRIFKLEENSDGKPIVDVLGWTPADGFSWNENHWTATGAPAGDISPIATVAQDGKPDTYITSKAFNGVYLQTNLFADDGLSPKEAQGYVGFSVIGEFATGTYDAKVIVYYLTHTGGGNFTQKGTVTFDLNYLKGQGKVEARFIAPVMQDPTINRVNTGFTVTSSSSLTGLVKVYEFRALQANATLLDQIARAQIRLPARELAEVECNLSNTNTLDHLLSATGKTLVLEGAPPGTTTGGEIAEIVTEASTESGLVVRIALGEPIRDSAVKAIQRAIKAAVGT